jgi:hypothetical protein
MQSPQRKSLWALLLLWEINPKCPKGCELFGSPKGCNMKLYFDVVLCRENEWSGCHYYIL